MSHSKKEASKKPECPPSPQHVPSPSPQPSPDAPPSAPTPSTMNIDKITCGTLKVNKLVGFSPIDIDDDVIFHSTITSIDGGETLLNAPSFNFYGPNITTTATGGSGTLPAQPVGFFEIKLDGTTVKIPYYS